MSSITVRQAAEMTGKSRQTINDATKDGTLSFTKNKRGHKVIDIAELSRVYDIEAPIESLKEIKESRGGKKKSETTSIERKILEENLEKSHERERSLMKEQIDLLKETIEEVRKDKETYVRLLEDKRAGGSENKDEINQLKEANETLSKQVQTLLDKEEKRAQEHMAARRKAQAEQAERKKQEALEQERNKGFFKKLFG